MPAPRPSDAARPVTPGTSRAWSPPIATNRARHHPGGGLPRPRL